MDKYEVRRLALQRVVDSFGRGGIKKVADKTGIDQSYISRMLYEAGKKNKKNIGEDSAEKIAAAFPFWLDDQNESHKPKIHLAYTNSEPGVFVIQQFEDVAGAMGSGVLLREQPGQITNMRVTGEWIDKNVPHHTGKNNLAIVTGFGNSMIGMFNSGDPLLVDTGVKSVEFDGVYFFRVGEEGFIKLLQRIPGEGIRVISKNQDYESWTIRPDMDFEVFARVIKVWNGTDL